MLVERASVWQRRGADLLARRRNVLLAHEVEKGTVTGDDRLDDRPGTRFSQASPVRLGNRGRKTSERDEQEARAGVLDDVRCDGVLVPREHDLG